MQLFCARFCIFGKESEDWYRHWSSLHFDPASDADIDDVISQVKTLARLLNFPDPVVLAMLKNMFPHHRLHFFNVNDLPTMYCMLHVMFPRNRNQAIPGATGGASPFSAHQNQGAHVSLDQGQWPTNNRKPNLRNCHAFRKPRLTDWKIPLNG